MKFKNSTLLLATLLLFTGNLFAQELYDRMEEQYQESCTSIMVASGASSDGSVMVGHTCDANYRTWLTIEPRKSFSIGDMEPVYEGMMHNEEPWDMRKVVEKGRIPVAGTETYRFLNVSYPCLNEKQLAIGETTTEGRPELLNRAGMFYIEELERMALQYCTTAREAISLMGRLAEDYGYADWGESALPWPTKMRCGILKYMAQAPVIPARCGLLRGFPMTT